MRAIGYIRVSTQEQVTDGVSLDAQESKIKAWADLNEYESVTIYKDAGISGSRFDNRENLQEALNLIEKNDALVVYSLSRLAQSTRDTLKISDLLLKKEADFASLSEKIDTTTASGKMVFRMLAILNEFERDQISERTRTSLQYKKSKGEKTGGDIPFGYDVTDNGHLIENSDEQKALKIIKRLRKKKYSLRKICEKLKTKGHKTKRGLLDWKPKTVSVILKRIV